MTRPRGIPTSRPVVGPQITARLRAQPRPRPVATRLVASDALRCARRIGFGLFGVPVDIPFTAEEKARFEEGDFVDQGAAEVLIRELDARAQVPFDLLPRLPLRGKADATYLSAGGVPTRTVVEVKSATQKAWSRSVGLWESVPPAPKPEWLVQAGLAALSRLQAQQVHIILVDKDNFDTAEWVIGIDDPLAGPDYPETFDPDTGAYEPATIRRLVEAEGDRLKEILADVDAGTLPARALPGYGLVEVPPARDEDRLEPWACRFCAWQPTCSGLNPVAVPDFADHPARIRQEASA